jgi:glycerol-3-phosphate acyltransferase PlsY
MHEAWIAIAVLAAYLVGSIDFGVIVSRMQGVDIYATGSGNPGATNVLRSVGRKAAVLVMVGDLSKGVAAAAMGWGAGGRTAGYGAGLAAVVGHCFPVWHRFRGGKGVAAAGGMTLFLEPVLGAILVGAWVAGVALTRKVSVSSLLMAVALVPGLVVFGERGWPLLLPGAACLLIVARHSGNIRRLLAGSEADIEEAAH